MSGKFKIKSLEIIYLSAIAEAIAFVGGKIKN